MKRLAILFGLLILAIIILADLGQLGFLYSIYDFPYGDKVGHFLLYGILTLLIDLAFLSPLPTQRRRRVAVNTGLLLTLVITVEEFSQQYFSSRTFDLVDLTASYLGVLCFTWLALKIKTQGQV